MRKANWILPTGFVLAVCLAQAQPLRLRVTLAPEAASAPVSGRMLVFMTDEAEPRETLSGSFFPGRGWVAALEFESIAPGETVEFDPDVRATPRAFSKAPRRSYQIMALLDRNHSYPYTGQAGGDLYGPVVRVADLDPAHVAAPIALTISKREPERGRAADTAEVKVVEFQSALLTRFWGRPITMRAGVVLPPSFAKSPERRFPAVYVHHGFGGSYRGAFGEGLLMRRDMARGKAMESVLVFLDGSFPGGDHEFADSVNNGPWGRALTEEFIPYLERRFRLIAKPSARFVTGHSSGGWASLWAQVTYPDFYGGAWPTSPDPVDFRSFCGVNATPGSKDNVYRAADGTPRNLIRDHERPIASWEAFAQYEQVLGMYGGQLASFEAVFSPRGADGRPMRMFNRVTGELDQNVLEAWRDYDIRLKLEREWPRLGPKLKGKLHIFCGDADTFHLEEATKLLCGFLKDQGEGSACEIVPGRTHMDLYEPYKTYPDGLALRIAREMRVRFEAVQ